MNDGQGFLVKRHSSRADWFRGPLRAPWHCGNSVRALRIVRDTHFLNAPVFARRLSAVVSMF